MSQLDQCMYGAAQDGVPTRKHSKFVPDFPLKGMDTRCDKTHSHQQLRGSGPLGSRTASAARYPPKLCDAILDSITASRSTPQDGGGEGCLRRTSSLTHPALGTGAEQTRWRTAFMTFGRWPGIWATRTCTIGWWRRGETTADQLGSRRTGPLP